MGKKRKGGVKKRDGGLSGLQDAVSDEETGVLGEDGIMGEVDQWEKDVYEKIVAADADKSGSISVSELFSVIKAAGDEVREAAKGGIPISTLNPDSDGDGKVEKWEVETDLGVARSTT